MQRSAWAWEEGATFLVFQAHALRCVGLTLPYTKTVSKTSSLVHGKTYNPLMDAWNGWYHVNTGTYGGWLPGDPRGWRSRHHRVHVDGDYKNPPPDGKYEQLHKRSQHLMKSPPVLLADDEKRIAGQALVEMLMDQGVELLVLSLDAVHCHLLARFGNLPSRQAVGRAKKHAYHILGDHGRQGRVWEKKCRTLPVKNRSHQLNVYQYILDHAKAGAWVWTFKEGLYWRK